MNARASVSLLMLAGLGSGPPTVASASATAMACQARGTYSPSPPPVDVSFEALAGDGRAPYAFEWDFGDGATSSEQNPSHTYTWADRFYAVVRVTDSGAPPRTCLDTVRVDVGIVADYYCSAVANATWGDAPLSVQLSAAPGFVSDPEPYAWTWRFGDGSSGAGQSTDHDYAAPGTYWAAATLHTPVQSYDCYPTIRVSALAPDVADVGPFDADRDLRLEPARPNPFRVMTAMAFGIPRPGHVRLAIVDVSGRSVAELVNGHRPSGRGVGIWQGRDASGRPVRPGLYFARLEYEGIVRSIRLVRTQ